MDDDLAGPHERVEHVDADGRVIEIVTRARMRAENLLHRSTSIVVLDSDGRLLVHRRADTKDLHPGRWDVAAGGVVAAGEASLAAAERELAEEVGLIDAELTWIGAGRFEDDRSRELCEIYRTVHDGPFVAVDGEIAEFRLVSADELVALMRARPFVPSHAMVLPLLPSFADVPARVGTAAP